MAKTKNTIEVLVSHNQEINGKAVKPGDTVSVSPRLAKVLASRGAVQFKSDKDREQAATVAAAQAGTTPAPTTTRNGGK